MWTEPHKGLFRKNMYIIANQYKKATSVNNKIQYVV
jgi:hypothetical protein